MIDRKTPRLSAALLTIGFLLSLVSCGGLAAPGPGARQQPQSGLRRVRPQCQLDRRPSRPVRWYGGHNHRTSLVLRRSPSLDLFPATKEDEVMDIKRRLGRRARISFPAPRPSMVLLRLTLLAHASAH
jgi:hypothetical protein